MAQYQDYPIEECARTTAPLIQKGVKVFQKFTCTGCGARQTMDTPNVFYTSDTCQECGAITDIALKGCNYLVHAEGRDAVQQLLKSLERGG